MTKYPILSIFIGLAWGQTDTYDYIFDENNINLHIACYDLQL